nr:CTLH/CRA C-terminal to LisH motif domain containing protein [Ipomoea batatas]
MDSMPVNWEALDTLIFDFAKSENLIDDSASPSPSPSTPSSSSFHLRLLIRQIRRCLEAGEVDAAMDLLRLHAPSVLDDHRLLFRLQKQKFIELLRKGTDEDRETAIDCLRTSLAPCALDAYPEAYEEFKHVLLALIYARSDRNSPVANEWSEKRRFEIAGLLSSILRAHLHAYDPLFAMTLRYLISIHKNFCSRQGVLSPISDLTERLLLEDRDPPATPIESLYEAPPFDEVDIQALAHAVELTRQGSVDSLRFAKGDLFQAFQNELCRMGMNVSVLDELVHEYCIYRGFVDFSVASPSGIQGTVSAINDDQSEPGCLPQNSCLEVGNGNNKLSDGEASLTDVHMEASPNSSIDTVNCSTSGTHLVVKVQKNRSHRIAERNKRKRWRGRDQKLEYTSEATVERGREEASQKLASVNIARSREDEYETLLGIKELASKGMAAEVFEEISAIDPNFFAQNPSLLFQLKQVEFLKLVSSGDHSGALKVACSYLGPLASSNAQLLKPLKETLLTLLKPNEVALSESLPLHALATAIAVATSKRLGIEQPQLMKILKATLYTHNEWFKLQMCKDRFEGLLKIDSLKDISGHSLFAAASKSDVDMGTHGSSQFTASSSNRMQEDGSSPVQSSARDMECDETAILKVMEFLALPRADAIHLLAQYNGNAEMVIQQIFA